MEIKIAVPQQFSFSENINYMSRSTNECMFHIENNKISKVLSVEQERWIVEVSEEEGDYLTVRFLGEKWPSSEGVRSAVTSHIREWFDLDTDLIPFYERAQQDPLLQKVVTRFFGLRTIGIPDLFEALCWGIIGQQINLAFAYTLKRRFVETFGQLVEWKERKYWVFPSPNEIARLAVSDLTGLQMTAKKSEYLLGVAKLMAEGTLSKELLISTKDYKMMETQLVKIRGIGPWTANYVLMRCLRAPSAFPIDDVGLHNAIKHLLEMDRKPSIAEIKHLSSEWTNWESYATFYLWRSIY